MGKGNRTLWRCVCAALLAAAASPASAATGKCPPDAVRVGPLCVDRYEASVWQIPEPTMSNKGLVKKLLKGKATPADFERAAAVALGCPVHGLQGYPAEFPTDGIWVPLVGTDPRTPGIYAASLEGVTPSGCITWFQASQACRLSGKRLLTNEEWHAAAVGTPDPGAADDGATTCRTAGTSPVATGSRSACVSHYGAFDMVGNVWEHVADWADLNLGLGGGACTTWGAADFSCYGGDGSSVGERIPSAIHRGGSYGNGAGAGPFAVAADQTPIAIFNELGFRCAR
jgi:formylglycine-generating enzyme required for sulfatase activity